MIAALYVETGGAYFGLDDVDPWDERRDARLYDGPWPVVAHPPCTTWSLMGQCRPATVARGDGGTFAAALAAVRAYGGVLEHPAYTRAWSAFALPYPSTMGWSQAIGDPGWATEVDQAKYGHEVRKRTWLYYVGPEPPAVKWGLGDRPHGRHGVSHHGGGRADSARGAIRSRTPIPFRDLLLGMARDAQPSLARSAQPYEPPALVLGSVV